MAKAHWRLLMVEDNPGDVRLVRELLKETGSISHDLTVLNDAVVSAEIRAKSYDAILLDLHLGRAAGVTTFRWCSRQFPGVPVVILTGLDDERLASRLVKAGAQDYLVKGQFDGFGLERAIRYAIDRKQFQAKMALSRGRTKKWRQRASDYQVRGDRLETLNRAKDTFIAVASHQLRTPATAVKQYLGMALDGFGGRVPERLVPLLKSAYSSNERQLGIINYMLKIARLEAGELRVNKQPLDLSQMLGDIIDEQSRVIEARKQRLYFRPPANPYKIKADHELLRMVFENLLDNASKYNLPEGSITVRLTNSVARRQVKVTIADTGIGIQEVDMPFIFDKFTRTDNGFARSPDGSGLGLYWAKRILDLHEATINISSRPGEGTQVEVRLPLLIDGEYVLPASRPEARGLLGAQA